jgi:hypothetical protein
LLRRLTDKKLVFPTAEIEPIAQQNKKGQLQFAVGLLNQAMEFGCVQVQTRAELFSAGKDGPQPADINAWV